MPKRQPTYKFQPIPDFGKKFLELATDYASTMLREPRNYQESMADGLMHRLYAVFGSYVLDHLNSSYEWACENSENLENVWANFAGGFHKGFRQSDIIEVRDILPEAGGHVDMLFWNALHMSNLNYAIFRKLHNRPVDTNSWD